MNTPPTVLALVEIPKGSRDLTLMEEDVMAGKPVIRIEYCAE